MGVDTNIWLPGNVAVKNVANAIGVLGGCRPRKEYFDKKARKKGWVTMVEGVSIETTGSPDMVRLVFEPERGDFAHGGSDAASVLYFFEPSRHRSMRLMNPGMCGHWIAIGVELVRMFGGHVDFNDCDNFEFDYAVPNKSDAEVSPSYGAAWYAFQEKLLHMKSLSLGDIETIDNVMVRRGNVPLPSGGPILHNTYS